MTDPRGMSREEAARYTGCRSVSTFSHRVKKGILPGPIPGTRTWDKLAIDATLDRAAGLRPNASAITPWTGQRQGDLLKLRWSDYDGIRIRLRQGKTGKRVAVRIGAPLKIALDSATRVGQRVLTNSYGQPWTSDGFRASWGHAFAKAKLSDLTFHDLRGSAVTRLALAGATPQEIAGVTGHSLADVSAMLDRHYLGERAALGEKAILRLEVAQRDRK